MTKRHRYRPIERLTQSKTGVKPDIQKTDRHIDKPTYRNTYTKNTDTE